jgi:RNA polymerase sigma-70 factor (ECF subfamily)
MTPMLAQRPRTDRAFERMYRRHVREVYRYALVVLRSPGDAEDITQATFLNAYRVFKGGKRPRSARNWLISLAHELCYQQARRQAGAEEVAVPEGELPIDNDVRRALGHLAFDERAALIMREVEGRSYAQIAGILDVSVGAVETLIFRARRTLREELEGALTCHEAERAISRRLDGRLARAERRPLRRHLRECTDCTRFERSQRAQRVALRSLANVPLPSSLASFFADPGSGVGSARRA